MDSRLYSNFPQEIDTFPVKTDLMYEQLADARRYQELKMKSYLTEVEQAELTQLTVKLEDTIWFSDDLNRISGGLTKLEEYFRDNTITQLSTWKQEITDFSNQYQTLTQLFFQSWTTTSSKDYDIHVGGNETLDANVEFTVDSPANIDVVLDKDPIGYDNYTIVANTSGKKTTIRFNADFTVPVGVRLEVKWRYTDGKIFTVNSHRHAMGDIDNLPTVATTGKFADLLGIPSSFTPSVHTHAWGEVTGKPSTFAPSAHNHDERYFTEGEMITKLAGKSDTGHKHAIADVTGLQINLTSFQGEIDSLKQSVSSGKTAVASAITAKGISASGGDTFTQLATKIGQLRVLAGNCIESNTKRDIILNTKQTFSFRGSTKTSSVVNFSPNRTGTMRVSYIKYSREADSTKARTAITFRTAGQASSGESGVLLGALSSSTSVTEQMGSSAISVEAGKLYNIGLYGYCDGEWPGDVYVDSIILCYDPL